MDTDIFNQIPLFENLSKSERDNLAGRFILRQHPKNSIIINEADDTSSFYIILKGRVKVYLTDESGKESEYDPEFQLKKGGATLL